MAARKLPEDAFSFYVALGSSRSYETVAKHYATTKRTVTRTADRENWSGRLQAIERKAREVTDAKLADQLAEMNERHRRMLLAMASRAASAIQQYPLQSGMEGMRAAEMVIKMERLLAAQPTDNRTLTVEQVTRSEMARLLTDRPEEDDWADEASEAESL